MSMRGWVGVGMGVCVCICLSVCVCVCAKMYIQRDKYFLNEGGTKGRNKEESFTVGQLHLHHSNE